MREHINFVFNGSTVEPVTVMTSPVGGTVMVKFESDGCMMPVLVGDLYHTRDAAEKAAREERRMEALAAEDGDPEELDFN